MGKDIIVSINAENGSVYTSTPVLGISGENLEGQIIVEFFNGDFVDGEGTIEIERGGEKGFISMTKDEETKTYRLPIKSSLLSVVGKIKMQVKIDREEKAEGVPTFKSAVFEIAVGEAINATSTIPDEYPTWLDDANAKIAEMDALMTDMEEKVESGYFNGDKGDKGDKGDTGTGIPNTNALQFPYGSSTVTFDTTDGMHITGKAQITYTDDLGNPSATVQPNLDMVVPIKQGQGIIMVATGNAEAVEVKVDNSYIHLIMDEEIMNLAAALGDKRDVIPLPSIGTRFYTANNKGQSYANGSTGAYNKFDVVQRTDNAQIKAPNQATFPPLDDEYVSKEYADAHYGGGIAHYLVHWGMFSEQYSDGAKCQGTFLATAKEEGMDYSISTAPHGEYAGGTTVGSVTFRIKTGVLAGVGGYSSPLAIVQQRSIQFDPNNKLNDQFPVGLYCKDDYTPMTSTQFPDQTAWDNWYNSIGYGSPSQVGYWIEQL